MPLDPESVPQQTVPSLQSCLVEGDPEQRLRERRIRRKALVTSVFLQAGILAVVILVPLFAKPARLITGFTTPLPPYRPVSGRTHATQPPRGNVRRICVKCFNSHPANLAASNRVEPSNLDQPTQDPGPGDIPSVPCPSCINIPAAGPTAPPTLAPHEKRMHVTRIDPAMLIHRVEPVYPTLARQIGRAGRVELRAVIATDGTIQSLQVISGDPFFYQSALDAVRQWRYRPTVLNGEPVEIDTFISIIYNMDRGR
jgi:periplasmic protein TonB